VPGHDADSSADMGTFAIYIASDGDHYGEGAYGLQTWPEWSRQRRWKDVEAKLTTETLRNSWEILGIFGVLKKINYWV
jgi:hypothetical protein